MRIILITDVFPPHFQTSVGTIVKNFAQELKNRGHKILIITSTQNKKEAGRSNFQGLDVWRVYASFSPRLGAYLGLYNPQSVKLINKIIKQFSADVIHAHLVSCLLSYHCLKLAKKTGAKVFLTAHDVMLVHYEKLMPKNGNYIYRISIRDQIKQARKRYNPFRNIVIHRYLKYVDKIFAVSNSLKKLLEINGIKNLATVYNGIDLNGWQVDKIEVEKFKKKYNLVNKKVLIFTARLIEAKGGDELIKSLALVNKKFSNFILLAAGKEWAYTEKMKQLANDSGIGDKIVFTGLLRENELKTAYHSADISVFPSLCFETFGMGNLEAMVCKKPVVSTYFGGPKEVVADGKTGYLVNPNNVELMAEKIIDLLKNSEKAKRFGQAGYLRARKLFSLDGQVEKTLKWYTLQ